MVNLETKVFYYPVKVEIFANDCHNENDGRFCEKPAKPTIRTVSITDLIPTQGYISEDIVKKYKKATTKRRRPRVVESAGILWVDDGHHRIMAAKELGKTTIEVNVHQYDPAKHRPAQGIDYTKPETAKFTWDKLKRRPSRVDELKRMIAELQKSKEK